MKYCPYCGSTLADGTFSFCMECGKELPINDAERSISQIKVNEGKSKEASESDTASQRETTAGKRSEEPVQKQNNIRVKERLAKKKSKPSELSEQVKQTIEVSKEPQQIFETNPEDDYDGYYDDLLPVDEGCFSEGIDKNLIKKVVVIMCVVLLIVILCVLMMYAL